MTIINEHYDNGVRVLTRASPPVNALTVQGFDALIGANRGCLAAFQAVYGCAVPVMVGMGDELRDAFAGTDEAHR